VIEVLREVTVDLVNALEREKVHGRAGLVTDSLLPMDLVVLDELGTCRSVKQKKPCCSNCSAGCTSTPA